MAVHIAPIGKQVAHVKEWLRESTRFGLSVTKVWLIHSKKGGGINFPKIAKDFAKKIQEDYVGVDVELNLNDNPLNLDGTMDAIDAIIFKEQQENDLLEKHEFIINITGGTNVMSAAAILSAAWHGTKAHYVLNRNMNPGQKSYVEELPIPIRWSIGIARMNRNQQKVLQVILTSTRVLRAGDKVIEKFPGVVTNQELLTKMGWSDKVTSSKRTRQEGATRLGAMTKGLQGKGYIIIRKEIPYMKNINNGSSRPAEYKKVTMSGVMYEITPAGRRQAKMTMMLDEKK